MTSQQTTGASRATPTAVAFCSGRSTIHHPLPIPHLRYLTNSLQNKGVRGVTLERCPPPPSRLQQTTGTAFKDLAPSSPSNSREEFQHGNQMPHTNGDHIISNLNPASGFFMGFPLTAKTNTRVSPGPTLLYYTSPYHNYHIYVEM